MTICLSAVTDWTWMKKEASIKQISEHKVVIEEEITPFKCKERRNRLFSRHSLFFWFSPSSIASQVRFQSVVCSVNIVASVSFVIALLISVQLTWIL